MDVFYQSEPKVTTWIAKLLAKVVAGSIGQSDLAERRRNVAETSLNVAGFVPVVSLKRR